MIEIPIDREEFQLLAETSRKRAQDLCADIARELRPGECTDVEAQCVTWALISGLVTAAANGLAGLERQVPGFSKAGLPGLQGQLDSAFKQALSMRKASND